MSHGNLATNRCTTTYFRNHKMKNERVFAINIVTTQNATQMVQHNQLIFIKSSPLLKCMVVPTVIDLDKKFTKPSSIN